MNKLGMALGTFAPEKINKEENEEPTIDSLPPSMLSDEF